MANLETKSRMSPLQLGIVAATMGLGVNGHILGNVISEAGRSSWLSALLGGGLFFGVAWLMVKLGDLFPGESIVGYMPRIWGRWLGRLAVYLFLVVLYLQAAYVLQGFSREIAFFMFDRTPFEVVEASLLAVCAYCALQEWGTILRVTQYIFFTALPAWLLLILLGALNFRSIHLMPLWPQDWGGLLGGTLHSWELYAGYEIVLLLLPWVFQGNIKAPRGLAAGFLLMAGVFALWLALILGALTPAGAKNVTYPAMTLIRIVELPGTFVERLDTYYLLFWIQTAFVYVTLLIYGIAVTLAQAGGFVDHRPLVAAVLPLIFLGGDASHNAVIYQGMDKLGTFMGLSLSLGVIPLSYALTWWRRRKAHGKATG